MKRRGWKGFTLIELMVALAVFVMMAALLASLVGSASSAWTRSREKMDAFAKGRALMNALQRELRNGVFRDDLPAFPNEEFSFYSTLASHDEASLAQAPADARALTYVSYLRADDSEGRPVLKRVDRPYFYRKGGSADAPAWKASEDAVPTSGILQPRQLCEGVYAFRYAFIQADGNVSKEFSRNPANPTRAVQVSIAVLSDQAEMIVEQMNRRGELEELFDSVQEPVAGSGWSPKARWDRLLLDDPRMNAFPAQVRTAIRTYERIIPIQYHTP